MQNFAYFLDFFLINSFYRERDFTTKRSYKYLRTLQKNYIEKSPVFYAKFHEITQNFAVKFFYSVTQLVSITCTLSPLWTRTSFALIKKINIFHETLIREVFSPLAGMSGPQ